MMRLTSLFAAFLLAGLLAACAGPAPTTPAGEPLEFIPSVEPPSGVAAGGATWEREPGHIVFRADVVGGEESEPFHSRNQVPLCTVYGDNRVVWTNELAPFVTEVLYDQVSDDAIRVFVDYLVIGERIYDHDARARLQVPSQVEPVVEIMQLNVSGQPHETDGFSGWSYEYFQRIVDRCKTISSAPVLFEPTAAWLSVRAVPYNYNRPLINWDPAASGLDLAPLAESGERTWLTGPNVPILWNLIQTNPPGMQFIQGEEQAYEIALEVPYVNRDAPPPPAS